MSDNTVCTTVNNIRKSLVFNVPGTRYTPVNPYSLGYTQTQLDMRRKAEILQYNNVSTGKATKKQSFVTAVKGSLQRRTFSNYYLKTIQDGAEQSCPNDIYIPTLTTASDVPGPAMYLTYDPAVPLYNYNSQQQVYGTQNIKGGALWLTNYDTDILDDNEPQLFTLNIQPSIDSNNYRFSFTTSVSLYITGSNTAHPGADASGTFTMNIPIQNLNLTVMYGGQPANLSQVPTITYSPGFLTDVSGYVLTRAVANQFNGDIYMGDITFSNILLSTYNKNTYDFYVEYIPNYVKNDNIDNFFVFIKTNRSKTSQKLVESGLKFLTPASMDPITTFSLSGSPI
jgi:hypothetical protein